MSTDIMRELSLVVSILLIVSGLTMLLFVVVE
jgi:hypothetical protein